MQGRRFTEKYDSQTVKDLKRSLKDLKSTNFNINEIKYASRILHNKLRIHTQNDKNKITNQNNSYNHDKYI